MRSLLESVSGEHGQLEVVTNSRKLLSVLSCSGSEREVTVPYREKTGALPFYVGLNFVPVVCTENTNVL